MRLSSTFCAALSINPAALLAEKFGENQKNGGQTVDIVLFGILLVKAQNDCSKNQRGNGPIDPPGYAYE